MDKRASLRRWLLPVLCSLALPVSASNFGFLKDSLMSDLSGKDIDSLQAEIANILETTPDKEIVRWQAPDSKVTVKILPKLSYSEAGLPCRRTLLNFSAPKKHAETYGFTICKNSASKWQVADSRLQALRDDDIKLIESHALQALESGEAGVPVTWFNPGSKVNGTVVLLDGAAGNCKNIAISLFDSKGVSLEGQYRLCKTDKGWQREAAK